MLNVKGFISLDKLINNAVGTIGQLGELSTYGATFTTKIAEYSNDATPDLHLITTHSVDDSNGQSFELSDAAALSILTVAQWINAYNATHTSNYTSLQLQNDLMIAFPHMSDVSAGQIASDASNWLPEFVGWTDVTLGNYVVKIWFSDTAFRAQYDEYSIVVVPPLQTLDAFFGSAASVVSALSAVSVPSQMDRITTAKGDNPETVIRAYTYNYVAPGTGALTPTTWYAIIYGPAGDNEDTIKQAFIDYVLSHSTHNQTAWTAIIPDLFLSTEFTFVPLWEQVAIPVMNLQPGVYSPITNPNTINAQIVAAIPNYPAAQCTNFVRLLPITYKSLMLMSVGGPQNRNNKYLVADYFGDYIDVGTQSTDFGRQATSTQDFVDLLERLVIAAESMTAYSTMPSGIRRVTRNGNVYAAADLNNILFLVWGMVNEPPVTSPASTSASISASISAAESAWGSQSVSTSSSVSLSTSISQSISQSVSLSTGA